MDLQNPAVTRHTTLTPADIEAVATDPSLIEIKSRQMLLVQLRYTHDQMGSPNTPLTQRMKFVEILAGLSGANAKANAPAAQAVEKFSVNIIIDPASATKPVNAAASDITIDTEAVEVVTPKTADESKAELVALADELTKAMNEPKPPARPNAPATTPTPTPADDDASLFDDLL